MAARRTSRPFVTTYHGAYAEKGRLKRLYNSVMARSDRVIAHSWDATFTLFDGVPTAADIERLSWNVPKQEAGRVSNREISLSRANRSVRLFEHAVDSLAAGHQPDREQIEAVGYLMRTTAV